MYFHQAAPNDTIMNFESVHFGNRSGISSHMPDLSPEHIGVVARTARLQGYGRESDPPSLLGVDGLMGCHKPRQYLVIRLRFLNTVVHMKRNRGLDVE